MIFSIVAYAPSNNDLVGFASRITAPRTQPTSSSTTTTSSSQSGKLNNPIMATGSNQDPRNQECFNKCKPLITSKLQQNNWVVTSQDQLRRKINTDLKGGGTIDNSCSYIISQNPTISATCLSNGICNCNFQINTNRYCRGLAPGQQPISLFDTTQSCSYEQQSEQPPITPPTITPPSIPNYGVGGISLEPTPTEQGQPSESTSAPTNAASCKDFDDDAVDEAVVQSYVKDRDGFIFTDICVTPNHLGEMHCNNNNKAFIEKIDCLAHSNTDPGTLAGQLIKTCYKGKCILPEKTDASEIRGYTYRWSHCTNLDQGSDEPFTKSYAYDSTIRKDECPSMYRGYLSEYLAEATCPYPGYQTGYQFIDCFSFYNEEQKGLILKNMWRGIDIPVCVEGACIRPDDPFWNRLKEEEERLVKEFREAGGKQCSCTDQSISKSYSCSSSVLSDLSIDTSSGVIGKSANQRQIFGKNLYRGRKFTVEQGFLVQDWGSYSTVEASCTLAKNPYDNKFGHCFVDGECQFPCFGLFFDALSGEPEANVAYKKCNEDLSKKCRLINVDKRQGQEERFRGICTA